MIDIDFASKLPVSKGFKTGKVKCLCNIKNIDLSDYSKYFAYLTGKDILGANGIINIHTQCDNKGGLVVESEMSDFSLNMKNPLDSIKSNSDIKAISLVDFNKNVFFSVNICSSFNRIVQQISENSCYVYRLYVR